MKFFLLVGLLFVAIVSIGCGDAPANSMVNANRGTNTNVHGTNTNGIKPTGTPSSSATPEVSPTPAGDKKVEGMFSFPPPKVTSYVQIKNEYLVNPSGATNLSFVADRLADGLKQSGYTPNSFAFFWNDKNEFAVVTAMERVNSDGSPVAESDRWISSRTAIPLLPRARSGDEYVRFLLGGKTVYYRVFAFIVTSKWNPRKITENQPPEFVTARYWVTKGEDKLGGDGAGGIEALPFNDAYSCYALLYLFINHTSLDKPKSVDSLEDSESVLMEGLETRAEEHLTKTNVAFGAQ